MSDIINGPGKSQISSFDFAVMNPEYSGSTSLWDYIRANEYYLEGAAVEVILIYNHGSGLDKDDGLVMFNGFVSDCSPDSLKRVRVKCKDESENVHIDIPQTQINEENYPDWNDSGHGNEDVLGRPVPISLGVGADFLAYLVDTSGDELDVLIDTKKCADGGALGAWDNVAGKWRVALSSYSFNADENEATVIGLDNMAYVMFFEDYTPDSLDSGLDLDDDTDWLGESNANDGNLATRANCNINSTNAWPWIDFIFACNEISQLSCETLFAFVKASSDQAGDTNGYWMGCGPHNLYGSSGYWMNSQRTQQQSMGQCMEQLDDPPEFTHLTELELGSTMQQFINTYEQTIHFGGRCDDTSALLSFNEIYKLRWKLKAYTGDQPFGFYEADGRAFGSTWNSRKTAADAIASFPEAVEGILRHELDLVGGEGSPTLIDEASFDAANTALNAWTGKDYNDSVFKISGQQLDQKRSDNVIQKLCEESGLAYMIGPDGKHYLHMIETETTEDYTIAEADILEGSFKYDKSSAWSQIFNSFVINFDKNKVTGAYRQTISIHKDSGIASGGDHRYLEDRCQASFDRYGIERKKTINCDWISSEGTAWKFLDWLCYFYCFKRRLCSFRAKSHGLLKIENMDIALIKHQLTDLTSGEKFLIIETKTATSSKGIYTEHKGMFIESMGDRDDGDPE